MLPVDGRRISLAAAAAIAACATSVAQPRSERTEPGIVVERVRASVPPDTTVGDRMITIVRVDPRRYRFRMLTAERDGGPRPVPRWLEDFHLAGAINASMYESDGRSAGLLVQEGVDRTARDDERFGGFVAFDAASPGDPPFATFGRDCAGFDLAEVRRRYRSVAQSFRLLDCDGRAIAWTDPDDYSSAAIGTDRDGRVVLVHVRTPYRMERLARVLAEPSLRLRSLVYVEGGPEASLVVHAEGVDVSELGSYERDFHESDRNQRFWSIPNVIGFSAR
jgi:hypothetical protein